MSRHFPTALYDMLEEADKIGHSNVVSWRDNGKSFLVHKSDEMIPVLNRYFRQSKYKSFLRQLQCYGFHRVLVGPLRGTLSHPLLVRGERYLCLRMRRKGTKSTTITNLKQRRSSPIADNQVVSAIIQKGTLASTAGITADCLKISNNINIATQQRHQQKERRVSTGSTLPTKNFLLDQRTGCINDTCNDGIAKATIFNQGKNAGNKNKFRNPSFLVFNEQQQQQQQHQQQQQQQQRQSTIFNGTTNWKEEPNAGINAPSSLVKPCLFSRFMSLPTFNAESYEDYVVSIKNSHRESFQIGGDRTGEDCKHSEENMSVPATIFESLHFTGSGSGISPTTIATLNNSSSDGENTVAVSLLSSSPSTSSSSSTLSSASHQNEDDNNDASIMTQIFAQDRASSLTNNTINNTFQQQQQEGITNLFSNMISDHQKDPIMDESDDWLKGIFYEGADIILQPEMFTMTDIPCS